MVLLLGKLSKYCAYDDDVFDNWIREFDILFSILRKGKAKAQNRPR